MAELAKKLHLKKGTTEHLAKAYSTTAEAGTEYITNKIDGVTAYIPIGATTDSRATIGRVKKSGDAEKAILTMGKPPYTEKSWTTAGTYTFTIPQGVTRVRIALCGGGGASATDSTYTKQAGSGGISKFGDLIKASGGGGAWKDGYYNDTEDFNSSSRGGGGGVPNGRNGVRGNGAMTKTQGFKLSFDLTNGDYGSGACVLNSPFGSSGGSGGYNSNYVNVTPNMTYPVVVGDGGKAIKDSNSEQNGTSGFVMVAYGGNI